MKTFTFYFTLLTAFTIAASAQKGVTEHRMRGPYEFLENGKRVPRFFEIDGHSCTNLDGLKKAVIGLPPDSHLYWSPGCISYKFIELDPKPYITLEAFGLYCKEHRVKFDAYFGP
jgi:hypothetical protein